jgi:uncharacterized membrane protein YdfJ with MMPL/SSD domain
MTRVWWLAGGSVLSWLVVAALPGMESDREVLLGMIGPLAGAIGTWVLVERTYTSHPDQLMPRMIAAFAAKIVFFGAYVTLMLTVLSLRPSPFVISFTVYFIALYAIEARWMQRLFADSLRATD